MPAEELTPPSRAEAPPEPEPEPERPDRGAPAIESRATLVLGGLMVAAAGLLLWASRGQGFFADEWGYFAISSPGLDPEALLRPNSGNLLVAAAVLYKAILGLFGASYLPFRIAWLALDLACAALFFALARPWVGPWPALAATTPLLFLGASWEVLGGPLGITVLMAMASGMGMLLALRRGDRAGEIAACALLALSIATYSVGVAFAAAAAVVLWLRGREGLRAVWVVAVPLILYGAWRLWAAKYGGTTLELDNLLSLPASIYASAAAALAALSGTFRDPAAGTSPEVLTFDTSVGEALVPLLAVLVVARVAVRGRWPLDGGAWIYVALLLVYWAAIGANLGPLRAPEASRYQYASVAFVLLAACRLAAGARISRGVALGIGAAVALSLLGNVANLLDASRLLRENAEQNRAQLAALELERELVDPGVVIEPLASPPTPLLDDMLIVAGDYFVARDQFGSPADEIASLPDAAPAARARADLELIYLLRIAPVPVGAEAGAKGAGRPASQAPLRPESAEGGELDRSGDCLGFVPRLADARATMPAPPGGVVLDWAPDAPVEVALRRFGDDFIALPPPAAGSRQLIALPADASPVPWRLRLTASDSTVVCPASATPLAPAPASGP